MELAKMKARWNCARPSRIETLPAVQLMALFSAGFVDIVGLIKGPCSAFCTYTFGSFAECSVLIGC